MNRRDILTFGGASALTWALPRSAQARTGFSMIKMVFVGDQGIGKSCMLVSYTTNRFPAEGVVAGFDTLTYQRVYQGQPTQLELADTPGAEAGEALALATGSAAYRENSGLNQAGLAQTFQTLIDAARGEPVGRAQSPIRREPRPGQTALTPARRPVPRRGGG